MDNFGKVSLIVLSLQLFILSLLVSSLSYKLGYAKGQMDGIKMDYSIGESPDAGYQVIGGHHVRMH